MARFSIDPDIAKARTPDKGFYTDPAIFAAAKEKLFAPSWQFIGDSSQASRPGEVAPFTLLEGYMDEPLVLVHDKAGTLRVLSNVCTHRGNLIAEEACKVSHLRCRYHGRQFHLDGKFLSMPEFKEVQDFPGKEDDLMALPMIQWGKWLFTSLGAGLPAERFLQDMMQRMHWLPLDDFIFRPELSRDFTVHAHWALYCENYLEGFHIPFVHAGLNSVIDFGNYTTELFPYSNLQLGIAKDEEDCFDLPASSIDYGKKVAAYYFFVFPNMMFNFYPWGLSINIVKPIGIGETKISFLTYVADGSKYNSGAGSGLDEVEMEDEEVVEAVQKGVRSRFYTHGRYSVTREQGTHHFHRIMASLMGCLLFLLLSVSSFARSSEITPSSEIAASFQTFAASSPVSPASPAFQPSPASPAFQPSPASPAFQPSPVSQIPDTFYLLRPDRVFDGEQMHEGWQVLVNHRLIVAAGTAAAIKIPPNTHIIELKGSTLLPGLIEGHSHLFLHPYNEIPWNDQVLKESRAERLARATVHARKTLLAGFTTVRDLGTEGAGYDDVGLKEAIEKGIIPGPHMIVATRAIVATGSYGPKNLSYDIEVPRGAAEADGEDALIKEVRTQIGKGADLIKVYADYRWGLNKQAAPTFTLEEIRRVVEVAGSSGRPVVVHASTAEGMRRSILAGVSTIEHGDAGTPEVFALMKEKGVALCPTLAAGDAIEQYDGWKKGIDPDPVRILKKRQTFHDALAAGVTICMGGDVGVYPHGDNAREMEAMVEYGMKPLDVLRSATSVNADVFHIADKLGRIKAGLLADLVVLQGDPAVDISMVRKVKWVMKEGAFYYPEQAITRPPSP